MSEDKLTRDDLVLLMESYRNMITMHQAILGQTTKTIEKLDCITDNQESLFQKNIKIYNKLNNIAEKLSKCSETLEKAKDKIENTTNNLTKKIDDSEKINSIIHEKIIHKIHMAWIGMGSIIIGLIGLGYTVLK